MRVGHESRPLSVRRIGAGVAVVKRGPLLLHVQPRGVVQEGRTPITYPIER